ncbi:MAG: oligosaccharide flippase family protein [Chloroflexi bacterium]|nr:oligosaccharide flippase family protein [Chloroflexota bacterium]
MTSPTPLAAGASNAAAATPPGPSAAVPAAANVSPAGRVARGALALLSTQPITWACSLLLTIYVPRYLSDAALGQFAMAGTVFGIVGTVLALGIPTALVRVVAKQPEAAGRIGTSALALLLGLSALGGGAVALVVGWWHVLDLPSALIVVALLGMLAAQAQSVLLSVLNGQERLGAYAWINAGAVALGSLASVAALVAGGGVVAYMSIGALATCVATVVGWHMTRLRVSCEHLSPASLLSLARSGLPFLGSTLTFRIRGDAEVFLLGVLLSVEAVGWWTAAGRIIFVPLFIPTLLVTPLLPALTRLTDDRDAFDRTLCRTLEIGILVTFGACGAIYAFAPAVPGTLGWAAEYRATVPLIEALAFVTPLVALGMILGTALIALGKEHRWFVAGALATGAYLVLLPLSIAAFGAWDDNGALGAAAVKVLVEVMMVGGALVLLPREIVRDLPWRIGAKTLLASLALVLVARSVLPLSVPLALPLAIVAAGLVYGASLLVLRAVTLHDLSQVTGFLVGMLKRRAVA